MKRKPKLGSGKRFAQLKEKLSERGAENPGALAAFIGTRKLGKKKMQQMAKRGRMRNSQ